LYLALHDISALEVRKKTVRKLVYRHGIAPGNSNPVHKEFITPNIKQAKRQSFRKMH